jgi:CRP-like cAMP-binding protein
MVSQGLAMQESDLMPSNSETLLRAILSMAARQAFPPSRLRAIVLSRGTGPKHLDAFNMCDGTKRQKDIAKALKLDAGNFSRTVARWINEGVVFRLGEGRSATLLHVYPLVPETRITREGTSR